MSNNSGILKQVSKYKFILITFVLICLNVVISIIYRSPENQYWIIIGLCKFLSTFSLVLISILNVRNRIISYKAAVFLIIALLLESFCDFLIEYSFQIGGVFSLAGLFFYSLSFITQSPDKKIFKKTVLLTGAFFLLFLSTQVLISVFALKSYSMKSDGTFLIYMLFLSLAAAIAVSTEIPRGMKIAMVCFYISDYVVYFQIAFGLLPFLRIINAVLYNLSQIIFVCSGFLSGTKEEKAAAASS